jgi:hypothetical protein
MTTELDQWQDPQTGYPTDAYQDAVIVALEAAGIGVHDSWRDEPHDFVIELHRDAFAGRFRCHDLLVGWRVGEESDPLCKDADPEWHGFHGFGQLSPGWWWMPTDQHGVGRNVNQLGHPEAPASPMHPLEEPEVVAAAVAAMLAAGHG